MEKSESVKELFKAMAKFQGELPNPTKDSSGHKYKYADLANCINAAKEHLSSNGLSVVQLVGDNNGVTTIQTVLGHSSGEFISTTCAVPIAKLSGNSGSNPAQVMGASITYMRRYQYAAIIGMAQQDDDAASATKGEVVNPNEYTQDAFDRDLKAILDAMAGGTTPDQVINNLTSQGLFVPDDIKQSIFNLPKPMRQS